MKPLLLTILIVCHSVFLVAQEGFYTVTGELRDSSGVVPFATVALLDHADSTMAKASLSSEDGFFNVTGVPGGKYIIKATSVGLEPLFTDPFLVDKDLQLGTLYMKQDSASMDALTVTALKPLIEILPDRTVFNVEGTLNATGQNAFELLRKAPGVIVDNNNNILVEGKTGTLIYIDGKPTLLAGDDLINYLKSIQSSDLQSIEIITQPSSRYDAAGNAGIIDIILKKDLSQGMNGTTNLTYRYGRNHLYNASVNLNFRKKKLGVYALLGGSTGKTWTFMYLDRTQEGAQYDSKSNTIRNIKGAYGRFGADYYLNDFNTIGVLFSGNLNDNLDAMLTETDITPAGSNTIEQQLIADNSATNQKINGTANMYYRFKDTVGHEFYFDVSYGTYNREAVANQPNAYYDTQTGDEIFSNDYRMETPSNIQIFTAKADYSQNFLKGKLSLGGKFSLVKTANTFDFYNVYETFDSLNTLRSNQFDYTENINATYINYARKWSEKWNMQLGLRAEQTNSEGILTSVQQVSNDQVKRQYLNWFPSGGVTYKASDNHLWSVNYSRRIQRPDYQSLNPFEYQTDELTYDKGNPFLQPQYTNTIRLSHTYKYTVTTSLGYSYISDFFAQITDTLGSNGSFLTPKNIADHVIYSATVSLPLPIKKWWNFYININGVYYKFIGTDEKFKSVETPSFYFYAQNTFSLGKSWKLEISGWFNAPSVWGGTYLTKSHGTLNVAVQKKWLNDKLSLRVAYNDIFFTEPWRADMEYGSLYIYGTGGYESRRVIVNLSYAFGRKEVKADRDRKTGLDEERDRVGG